MTKRTITRKTIKPVFAPRVPAGRFDAANADQATKDDLAKMVNILKYRRAHGTRSHTQFVRRVLEPVFGLPDQFGNYTLIVGEAPTVAFMAHHDSVEYTNGRTKLHIGADLVIGLDAKDQTSGCLGADDGAGIFLILEMIAANVPGLYLIFAEEESGCIGSSAYARTFPEMFDGITTAISFDRHDLHGNQVITHMYAGRTCSPLFAGELCRALEPLGYVPDDGGLITDSMEFLGVGDVVEVTNITVGYREHHSPFETLDFQALRTLRDVLLTVSFGSLPVRHDPAPAGGFLADAYGMWRDVADDKADDEITQMASLIDNDPYAVATLFRDMGYTSFELAECLGLNEVPIGWKA